MSILDQRAKSHTGTISKLLVLVIGAVLLFGHSAGALTPEAEKRMDAFMEVHFAEKITTEDVIRLLELKVLPEELLKEIAYRAENDPTLTFSLTGADVARLKKAGATEQLIEGMRSPISAIRFAAAHEPQAAAADSPAKTAAKTRAPEEDTARGAAQALQQFHFAAKPTTKDVLDLLELKVPTEDISSEIGYLASQNSNLKFSLSDSEIKRLKAAGASDALIDAMRSPIRLAQQSPSRSPSESSTSTAEASPSPSTSASGMESPAEEKAPEPEQSLVSLSAGAYVVKRPREWMDDESAFHFLDEKPRTKWATPRGDISPQTIVIALPDKTLLKTLEFDNSHIDSQFTGCSAKDITVEMSDTSEGDGFQKIADLSLKDRQDNQRFPVSAEVPGRWVRLTVKNNHNPSDPDNTIELSEFRAFGEQLTHTPLPNISGTYETYFTKDLHLKQEGTSVTGCYEANEGRVDGGIEGRAFKFTYYEKYAGKNQERGLGVMVFSPDGKQLFSLWQEHIGRERLILGAKKSDNIGSCPGWASEVQDQMTKEMQEFGRVRVYGINFDSDSDHIKDESRPTLDKIVAMLKAKADWKMSIEGHTDSTSTPQHNQGLSERRAASVKNYLTSAGIDLARLTAAGYGQTKPVADNDSPIGRAQNRRVELSKQ